MWGTILLLRSCRPEKRSAFRRCQPITNHHKYTNMLADKLCVFRYVSIVRFGRFQRVLGALVLVEGAFGFSTLRV